MNWRQFTVALVQALAWPSVVLVVLLAYRRRVAQLLGDNLRRLTVGPFEAEWDRVAGEVRASVEAASQLRAIGDEPEGVPAMLNAARAWVDINPAEAIRLGWVGVVWALDEWAEREMETMRLDRRPERPLSATHPGAAAVLRELRALRDLGTERPGDLLPRHAREFVQLADDLVGLLAKPARSPAPSETG
ncbi:hypothetical protein GCM10029963_45700 [Micromonospora andamanensis]|uniref:hypothetical protein n=1 Tax=Micromonospora andamanensis TaxID=1287068 RepID=UPI00194FB01C|nr:hypothetical protein [Micromonospora andamanensis]GIJ42995.1 hypothetical protein Vwe01_63200 [Micromonospora andamanensis]